MKAAIYVRVSTVQQADKDSLPMQKKDLIAYSQLILGIDDYEIFEDAGYSGKNTDRPAFQSMMAEIRNGTFTHLLVWKIDRISRNLLDFSALYKELKKLRVTFVSKNEQFDTSTAIGEAMLKIILVFAELERNMTSERVTATMLSKASAGQWCGGIAPYGYRNNNGIFTTDDSEAKIIMLIKDDYIQSHSMLHVAKLLNENGYKAPRGGLWTVATIRSIIENPFYAGVYRYNVRKVDGQTRIPKPQEEWILVYGHHPAIYSIDDYNTINNIRNENHKSMRKIGQAHYKKHSYPFTGLVYCGICGSKMSVSTGKMQPDGTLPGQYLCPLRRNTSQCRNPALNGFAIGETVLTLILNIINAKKTFSSFAGAADLEQRLLLNLPDVKHITGVEELYDLLSRYRSDDSFYLPVKKKPVQKSTTQKEIEKQTRALERLNRLYLYSDSQMSEKDYVIQKTAIMEKLENLKEVKQEVNDTDFIRMASHLLISSYLQNKEHVYFRQLASEVSPDILHEYMSAIIKSVHIANKRVIRVTFANGLSCGIESKKTDSI